LKEEADDGTKKSHLWYNLWGVAQFLFTISGALIYNWYQSLIKTNSWWKQQCPATFWTSASADIIAANSVLTFASKSSDTNTDVKKMPV